MPSRFLTLFLSFLFLLLSVPAAADLFGLPPGAFSSGKRGLSLVVYEDGRVLVRDVRLMALPADHGELAVPGVAGSLDPGSLQVRSLTSPSGFRVLETGVVPGLGSSRDLLQRFVGRTLRVRLPKGGDSAEGDAPRWREAELLAAGDPPVLRLAEGLYVGPVESYLLPDSGGESGEPRLSLTVENTGPAEQELEIAYLAQGLSWRADYRLDLDPSGDAGLFSAWATLRNAMDTGFTDARLTLVSGQVNREYRNEAVLAMTMDAASAKMAPAPGVSRSSVFAYHAYELERAVDLEPGETRQLALLDASRVKVERGLVSRFENFHMNRTPEPLSQAVQVRLTVANSEDNGLGLALPAGAVRVFQERKQAPALMVGEDWLEHGPVGKDLVLNPGNAFDVVVERVLKDFQRQGERGMVQTWEISCANSGDKAVDLVLEEALPGEWKVLSADAGHERSGSLLRFPLRLQAGEGTNTALVTYTVSITY